MSKPRFVTEKSLKLPDRPLDVQREISRSEVLVNKTASYLSRDHDGGDITPTLRALPVASQLPDRIASRSATRRQVAPEWQSLPQHELKHAALYAPKLDPLENNFTELQSQVAQSKETVMRVLAQSSEDGASRNRLRQGLTTLLGTITHRADGLATEAKRRLEEMDRDGGASTLESNAKAGDEEATVGNTLARVLKLQLVKQGDHAADNTVTMHETTSAPAAVKAFFWSDESVDRRRRPTRDQCVGTMVTVPLNTSQGSRAPAMAEGVLLPAELFDIPADVLLTDPTPTSSAVELLRQISEGRAARLVDSYKRREATVRMLLLHVANLRTQVKVLTLQHDDARSRVLKAFEMHGALKSIAETNDDIPSAVEEGVAVLWGELRREFHEEVAAAVRSAHRYAIDHLHAAQSAAANATKTQEEVLKQTTDELRRVSSALVEATARIATLDDNASQHHVLMADAQTEIRKLKSELLEASRREIVANEDIRRLESVAREMEGRIIEMRGNKREQELRAKYENVISLKTKEIETLKESVRDAKNQAVEAMMQVVAARKEMSSTELAAQTAQSHVIKQFVGMTQNAATAIVSLMDGLCHDNVRCRETTHSVITDLSRSVCVALSSTAATLPASEAAVAMATVASMRDIQAKASSEASLLTADTSAPIVADLNHRVAELNKRLEVQTRQFESQINDRASRERMGAIMMTSQAATAFRQLLNASASATAHNIRGLTDLAFPALVTNPTLRIEPLSDAWTNLKGSFHSVKRELVDLRSNDRLPDSSAAVSTEPGNGVHSGTADGLNPKPAVAPEPHPEMAVMLDAESTANVARRACQAALRQFADLVNAKATRPLTDLTTLALEQVTDAAALEAQESIVASRERRQLATRSIFLFVCKRAAFSAAIFERLRALDVAQSEIKVFTANRLADLANEAFILSTSADKEAAMDRVVRLKHALESRIDQRRQTLRRRAAERDHEFWMEFLRNNDEKVAALSMELGVVTRELSRAFDVLLRELNVIRAERDAALLREEENLRAQPTRHRRQSSASVGVAESASSHHVSPVMQSLSDFVPISIPRRVSIGTSPFPYRSDTPPSRPAEGHEGRQALGAPLGLSGVRARLPTSRMNFVDGDTEVASSPPQFNGVTPLSPSRLALSASSSSTAIALSPTPTERIISPGHLRPQSGALHGTRARPVKLHCAIRTAESGRLSAPMDSPIVTPPKASTPMSNRLNCVGQRV